MNPFHRHRLPDDRPPISTTPHSVPLIEPGPGFPGTFLAESPLETSVGQFFDPATSHFPHSYRPADVSWDDATSRVRRKLARAGQDHILRVLSEVELPAQLVLRGGRTMPLFVEGARESRDLDFVVHDTTVASDSLLGRQLIETMVNATLQRPCKELIFDGNRVAIESIWTYERASGKRVVIPWTCDTISGGIQLDVVFHETIDLPLMLRSVPLFDQGCAQWLIASPAQAFHWKLLWLATDMHPQGKDIYDAVLLGEQHQGFDERLIVRMLENIEGSQTTAFDFRNRLSSLLEGCAWEDFQHEYPHIDPSKKQWIERLMRAIGPSQKPTSSSFLDRTWLTSDVLGLCQSIVETGDYGRLRILADALEEAGCIDPDILDHCRSCGPHLRGCALIEEVLRLP